MLEVGEGTSDLGDVLEVSGVQDLSFDDRVADLDLVEPARVHR
jgi:hypothetical protein